MTTSMRQDQYITEGRIAIKNLWAAYLAAKSLQSEWNANSYGDNLTNGAGINGGITKTNLGAALFDGVNALDSVAANLTAVL